MDTKNIIKRLAGFGFAVALSLFSSTAARADNVVNDASGSVSFTSGGSADIKLKIVEAAAIEDGQDGCNAADGTAATVSFDVTSVNTDPTKLSVSPQTLEFTSCSVFQSVVISCSTPGDYVVQVNVNDSGSGTYHVAGGSITVTVQYHVVLIPYIVR